MKQSKKPYTPLPTYTDLLLSDFIYIKKTGDLSRLNSTGRKISNEELQKAWEAIFDKHTDKIKTRRSQVISTTLKDIELLQTRINAITSCVNYLSTHYDEDIVQELKYWTYVKEELNFKDQASYIKDLQDILSRTQELHVELKQLEAEFKELCPDASEPVDPDEEFENLIGQASKHVGFIIQKHQITISQFDFHVADMIHKVESSLRENE
jgi:hypothetical protein